mmetsp:Transcript_165681/g.531917  ORF Transcript_165681/g.531917 Transcript_165681/m.531917 type:complete len:741 (+) Transcript_165681:92-2314(+)
MFSKDEPAATLRSRETRGLIDADSESQSSSEEEADPHDDGIATSFQECHVVCSALGVGYGINLEKALAHMALQMSVVVVVPMCAQLCWMLYCQRVVCPLGGACLQEQRDRFNCPVHIIVAVALAVTIDVVRLAHSLLKRHRRRHRFSLEEEDGIPDAFFPASWDEASLASEVFHSTRRISLTHGFVRSLGWTVGLALVAWVPVWQHHHEMVNRFMGCYDGAEPCLETFENLLLCEVRTLDMTEVDQNATMARLRQRIGASWKPTHFARSNMVMPFVLEVSRLHQMPITELFGSLIAVTYAIIRLSALGEGRRALQIRDRCEAHVREQALAKDHTVHVRCRQHNLEVSLNELVGSWTRLDQVICPPLTLRTMKTSLMAWWLFLAFAFGLLHFSMPGLMRVFLVSEREPFLGFFAHAQGLCWPQVVSSTLMSLIVMDFVFFSCFILRAYHDGVLRMKVLRSTWHWPTFNILMQKSHEVATKQQRAEIRRSYFFLDLLGTSALGNLYAWRLNQNLLYESMLRERIRVESILMMATFALAACVLAEALLLIVGNVMCVTMMCLLLIDTILFGIPVVRALFICVELNYMRYQNISCLMQLRESILYPSGGMEANSASALEMVESKAGYGLFSVETPLTRRPSLSGLQDLLQVSSVQEAQEYHEAVGKSHHPATMVKCYQDVHLLRHAGCLDGIIELQSHKTQSSRLLGVAVDINTARKVIVVLGGFLSSNLFSVVYGVLDIKASF